MKKEKKTKRAVTKILIGIVILGFVLYGGVLGFLCVREKQENGAQWKQLDFDAIIVLGAQVKEDGTPSVQLDWRLNAALEAWQQKNVLVVTCGAQGGDEPAPEAAVMRDILTERGIPADQILTDETSYNTRQNISNAADLLSGTDVSKVLIVTSDYHLPRAMALAKDQGFDAVGLGSPCKPEYWLKNHARETLAWIKYWGQKCLGLNID